MPSISMSDRSTSSSSMFDVDLRLVPCEVRRAVASSLGGFGAEPVRSMVSVGALMLGLLASPASGWLARGKECAA
jgi:hypothetical protein